MQKLFNKDTVSSVLAHNAWHYSGDPAYCFDKKVYTWDQTDQLTDIIASHMIRNGIKKGMHVGFWSMNTIDLVFYVLAAMKIGAVPAAINYSYKAYELQRVMASADIEFVYYGESKKNVDFAAVLHEVCRELPKIKGVWSMDKKVAAIAHSEFFHMSESCMEQLYEHEKLVTGDDVAAITFTSGTTKVPKAVQVSFRSLLSDAEMIADRLLMKKDDKMMAPLPIFHSSGLSATIMQTMTKGALSFVERQFDAEKVMKDIDEHQITLLLLIPSMMELMHRHPNFSQYDFSSVRAVLTSGAKIASCRLEQMVADFGFPHFLMAYGQTECAPIVTTTLYDDPVRTAFYRDGVPLPRVDVRIWDTDRDALQAPGLIGEIQVRGVNVMKGYYNNEEENALKFTADGWLKTTDAGYVDKNGYLHFSAHMDDMIIWHGENISPSEIEAVICEYSDDIETVKVIGVPAEVVQEEITAVIQSKSAIDAEDLKQYIKTKLANFKVPKYIFQLEEFPTTSTGKPDVGKIRQIAAKLVKTARV